MGYAASCLPKAMAALGQDVHVVTSNVQVYFDSPLYKETYEPFLGPAVQECGTGRLDGYALYRLPHCYWRGRFRIRGLTSKLRELRPDVVQTFEILALSTYQAALLKPLLRYQLFTGSHIHASVFPPARRALGAGERFFWFLYRNMIGRYVNLVAEKCYSISTDAADIAVRFWGIKPPKIQICSLGVDTELFHPVADEADQAARTRLRERLGFAESDVVCIYTGRFTKDKGPLCLAQAVERLASQGLPFRGLFVGGGGEAEADAIGKCAGCVLHPFVPANELPALYRAADIGAWPKQESTSQLDAVACGLPIVLSNRVEVRERVEGNGLLYEEEDPEDLARQLARLRDTAVRRALGAHGRQKIRELYSWDRIAKDRIADYEAALTRRKGKV